MGCLSYILGKNKKNIFLVFKICGYYYMVYYYCNGFKYILFDDYFLFRDFLVEVMKNVLYLFVIDGLNDNGFKKMNFLIV